MTVEARSESVSSISVQELTAANFKLSLEVRSLRADLTQLKALRKYEDSQEVLRIKSAYEELENEVVELRKEKIRSGDNMVVKKEELPPVFSNTPSTPDSDVVSLLKDQLRSEREKYKVLESKYDQLRRDYGCSSSSVAYSDLSTSAGSPLCYREFTIEKFENVNIKPQMEEMFKKPSTRPRTVIPLAEVPVTSQPVLVVSQSSVPPRPTVKRNPSDPSIQRLAKIAKYRGN